MRARSLDAIPFDSRLVFDMEASADTSQRNPWDLLMYSVATYWYGKPGVTHNRPPLPAEAARPITSFEDMQARSDLLRRGGAIIVSLSPSFFLFLSLPVCRSLWRCSGNQSLRPAARGTHAVGRRAACRRGTGARGVRKRRVSGRISCLQLGVVAGDAALGPLRLTYSDLKGGGGVIPAAATECLSLGAIGSDGLPFTKDLVVPADGVQVLWCGRSLTAGLTSPARARLPFA